ncbi:MAG TPA: recombination protein NinB [Burkholderiaceae bacterium]|nr:recombination protein NinB [Burkholderiaceae bacterium]
MHTITLRDAQQARQVFERAWSWVKARTMSGQPVVLSLADAKRTLPQNDMIHPIVRQIARALDRKDEDVVRALLVEQWRHDTKRAQQYAPSIDGLRMIDVSNRTSALDKSDCGEFLDWLQAFAAATGVQE